MSAKLCGRCRRDLPESQFAPSQRPLKGSWCRSCMAAYRRDRREQGTDVAVSGVSECLNCGSDLRGQRSNAKYCSRVCQNSGWRKANPGLVKARHYKYTYGLPEDGHLVLLEQQDGRCGICAADDAAQWHVDHCHRSGRVRGVLCARCNHALGMFRDDPEMLAAAIRYLEQPARHGV